MVYGNSARTDVRLFRRGQTGEVAILHGGLTALVMVAVAATAVPPPASAATRQMYVAPWGSDSWPGTFARPFATPQRAQQAVRTRTARMRSDIVVNLRGGTYPLTAPLELSAAAGDSGTNGHRVRYQAYGYGTAAREQVVLSGGRRVAGWRRDGDVWRADVGDIDTRQLYVNGARAQRAALGAGLAGLAQTTKSGYVVRGTAPRSWRNPRDIELVYRGGFGKGTWPMAEARCGIAGISGDASSTTIVMDQPCYALAQELFESAPFAGENPRLGDPTDAENSPSFLSRPGSFYLDRSSPGRHVLSYLPRSGEDMDRADVVAPVLQTLVRGAGTLGAALRDVSFLGLTFTHATWLAPDEPSGFPSAWSLYAREGEENALTVPGNVVFQHTERITLRDNRFVHLGAQALEVSKGSAGVVVEGNVFTDVSAGAILMGVVLPDTAGVHRGNRVTVDGNVVHGYLGAVGGCADPFIRNIRFRGNFWDVDEPLWPCGDPTDVTFTGNRALPPAYPGLACVVRPACARILADAGLQPRYRHLLE